MKNFAFLLKDFSRRYGVRFEEHASEISLTLLQCRVLIALERNEGTSQAGLAELADMDPMMVVRIIDRMEASQLVERRADPADRRARKLYLTKKAKPLLQQVWRVAEITREEVFAGVSKADRETFMRVLTKLHENAGATEST
ncbi:MAG: MarR family transcriptional regulator [Steroidobacteraceae bacterium]